MWQQSRWRKYVEALFCFLFIIAIGLLIWAKKMDITERTKLHIKKHEGLRLKAYYDTKNVLTWGYGTNLEVPLRPEFMKRLVNDGPTLQLAEDVFDYRYEDAVKIARRYVARGGVDWDELTPVRQSVLINMAYNLGAKRLFKFKQTLIAIKNKDWVKMGIEMRNSEWWRKDAHTRAEQLAQMAETNKWSEDL